MDFIKISEKRMSKAIEEEDTILLSYFNPKDRMPLRRTAKNHYAGEDTYITLDGQKYILNSTTRRHFWIA